MMQHLNTLMAIFELILLFFEPLLMNIVLNVVYFEVLYMQDIVIVTVVF